MAMLPIMKKSAEIAAKKYSERSEAASPVSAEVEKQRTKRRLGYGAMALAGVMLVGGGGVWAFDHETGRAGKVIHDIATIFRNAAPRSVIMADAQAGLSNVHLSKEVLLVKAAGNSTAKLSAQTAVLGWAMPWSRVTISEKITADVDVVLDPSSPRAVRLEAVPVGRDSSGKGSNGLGIKALVDPAYLKLMTANQQNGLPTMDVQLFSTYEDVNAGVVATNLAANALKHQCGTVVGDRKLIEAGIAGIVASQVKQSEGILLSRPDQASHLAASALSAMLERPVQVELVDYVAAGPDSPGHYSPTPTTWKLPVPASMSSREIASELGARYKDVNMQTADQCQLTEAAASDIYSGATSR